MKHLIKDTKTTLKNINNASLQFLKPHVASETYKNIVTQALILLRGQDGEIVLKTNDSFQKVYASSKDIDIIAIRKKGYVYNALKTNNTFVISASELKKSHPIVVEQGIQSIIFIPLSFENEMIGVLIVRFTRNVIINQEAIEILKLYSSMASMAITKTLLLTQLKKALETRDLFIAMASHELKTPLTVISMYAQLLDKKLSTKKTQEGKYAQQLVIEAKRISLLVNELLQVDQIKTGKFNYKWEKNNLIQIVKRAITNTSFMYPSVKIKLKDATFHMAKLERADMNKLLQVFINLLTNAAKFSPKNEPITVTVSNDDTFFHIAIHDKGKGISPEDIAKIFDKFYKGSQNHKEGMGLGLYLTKKIIEEHKGQITIKSQPNHGTTIHIQLPIT